MKTPFLTLLLATGLNAPGVAQQAASRSNSYSAVGRTVTVYTTAQGTGQRLAAGPAALTFQAQAQPLETQPTVFVDPTHAFQTMIGIGGAMTDAAAETFAKLPKARQQEFLKAYFSPTDGIGYTLARTTIHSSDFSTGSYTYITDGDTKLKSFSIDHDRKYRLPFIKQCLAAAGGQLTMHVSPWSPPAWMKTNQSMLQGGQLLPEFRQPWADYYVKFIQAYEKEGVPIWGLTTQNEPMAKQKWESCLYTAEDERDFVKNFLGPTLKKAGMGDKKLIGWDHNRDLAFQRATTLFDDPEASQVLLGPGLPLVRNLDRQRHAVR